MKLRRRKPTLTAATTLAALFAQLDQAAARDILRPNAGTGAPPPTLGGDSGALTGDSGGAIREQTLVNSRDILARNSRALQDIRNFQNAARAAALAGPDRLRPDLPDVPNGMLPGGLVVERDSSGNPVRWQGAQLPVESASANGRVQVSVTQTASQALLNWQTFNIGKQTDLKFDQSAGGAGRSKWVVFNQVNDPSAAPSQILGSITADGQVYVINRNGIIFGGSSQVNTRGLTASALPLNENLVERGLLNNPDSQFLFSGVAIPAGANGTPAFTPEAPHPELGRYGDVLVQAGARLESALTADGAGGRVALFGANVENHGSILTPNGQTILAAGLQIGVAPHSSDDASLRGLDVYVGQVGDYAGAVTHTGLIDVPRGNATLAGRALAVDGAIDSTTSVALNGRIDLLANYGATANPESASSSGAGHLPFLNRQTGSVLLGEDSVLRILPELDSKATVAATELALRSLINLQGLAIRLGAGSSVLAPNAIVNFDAGVWRSVSGATPIAFVNAEGQIYLDKDSLVSVAGSAAVPVSVAQNIVAVELRGSELADSPLQRNGFLRGRTIHVDIRESGVTADGVAWVGTPLADASGYVGLIERGIGELTTSAGDINLNAGGSIVMQPGSRLDVSAGWIDYQGAPVQTTRLVRNGQIIDIADANPNVAYDGIYDGVASGPVRSHLAPLAPTGAHYEGGYIQGAAGGSITLTASALALDGAFTGHVTSGPRQGGSLPDASSFTINVQTRDANAALFPLVSPHAPTVTFRNGSDLAPADPFALDADGRPLELRADRLADLHLSSALLTDSGFGSLTVLNHEGDILLPASTTLAGSIGSSLTLGAANLDILGSIILPGGSIDLTAWDVSYATLNRLAASSPVNPSPDPDRGRLSVGSGALLSTAGLRLAETASTLPRAIRAGSISLSGHDTLLASGATLDVSGGVLLTPDGKISYGNAGSLSLSGGRDPHLASVLGGSLVLDGAILLGHAGASATAGSLSLLAPLVQIGGDSASESTLHLAPGFFSQGGFSSFSVSGIGAATTTGDVYLPGLVVAPGAQIRPVVESLLAQSTPAGLSVGRRVLDEGIRPAASLAFSAPGATDPYSGLVLVRGGIEIGAGSRIETDAKGKVSLNANTIDLLGAIVAPGGSISVSGGASYATNNPLFTHGIVTTRLGSEAVLDVSGRYLPAFSALGLRTGSVLAGGSIALSGNLLAEAGALLDASGASAILDLTANKVPVAAGSAFTVGGVRYAPLRVDSNGGSITLRGGQLLASDATLRAEAGGATAGGGTLSVSSGRFYAPGVASTTADINLTVTQSGPAYGTGTAGIGGALLAPDGTVQTVGGHFAADTFLAGGFDHLVLGGNVRFEGDVSLAARGSLRVSTSGVIDSAGTLRLAAPYVFLGQDFAAPIEAGQTRFLFTETPSGGGTPREYHVTPVHGSGRLFVEAAHLDLGTLALQRFGRAEFNAPSGDIRGNGVVNLAGDLVLAAGQIYPTTGSSFTVSAFDYTSGGVATPGSITVRQSGTRPDLPASAAGTLSLYASRIEQGGTLRAPFGIINLGRDSGASVVNPVTGTAAPITQNLSLAAGSLTSVSALRADGSAATLPYGVILDGKSWIDPSGTDITLGGLPAKAVNLAGADIVTDAGSTVDTRGGGDLFAYRFVPGIGGSADILASSGRFAIVPGKQPLVAPSAPYNTSPTTENLGGDAGYANSALAVGDQVYLSGISGLPAGYYTLLPARYALMPGAFLVTPSSAAPAGAVKLADGSSLVSGYRANGLTGAAAAGRVFTTFEVAPRSVVLKRADYQISSANTFLRDAAIERGSVIPRLPIDAGRLAFSATRTLELEGSVLASAPAGGRGSQVDIGSSLDIVIAGPSTAPAAPGTLVLDSSVLGQFGAASLLIGGFRSSTAEGDLVTTTTGKLTVDNAGAPLSGTDLILVARDNLALAAGAELLAPAATSSTPAPEPILLGDAAVAGSGDGALVRVSSSPSATASRRGVGDASSATLSIGEGASLSGGSLILDSSAATDLSSAAILRADALSLHSGRISLVLDEAGDTSAAGGLVLSGDSLETVLASARALSLLSYSSLDLFGSGVVGSASFQHLSLSGPAIRHFGSGDIEFRASGIDLGNSTGRAAPSPGAAPASGSLTFAADTLRIGAGTLDIQGFATTRLDAAGHIRLADTGGLLVRGDLALRAPLVVANTGATQTLDATGALSLLGRASTPGPAPASGLGARLELRGTSVALDGDIRLPSGQIVAQARSGDIVIGANSPARLDVAGTAKPFRDLVRVTDAGSISLTADEGDITIAAGSTLDLSAASAGGKAGKLAVSTPAGLFTTAGTLRANGGGSFALDTAALASTAALDALLNTAGFSLAREYRVRTGDVLIDGNAKSALYKLSADTGSLTVTGRIDASGQNGGSIALRAGENLTLASGARLDASGRTFSSAGKGGDVTLEAGAQIGGIVSPTARLSLQTGSIIDLSVATRTAADAALGRLPGTLSLRAPLTADNADVRIDAIDSTIRSASHVSVEGYRLYDLTPTGGLITAAVQTQIRNDGTVFLGSAGTTTAAYTAMRDRLLSTQPALADSLVLRPGAEIINRTGDLTLGSTSSTATADWNLATYRFGPSGAPGVLTLRAAGDLVFHNALSDGFNGGSSLWLSPLLGYNEALPANLQSWDFRLAAGADLSAADFHEVLSATELAAGKGNLLLGKNTGAATVSGGNNALTSTLIANNFQVIRTGSGDIDIAAGRDIRLLNPFASIYTAGTAVANPTTLHTAGDFSLPLLTSTSGTISQGSLGSAPQNYPVQYSYAGGDVTLSAQGDIGRYTRDALGNLIADSSRQLPNNWLYRRGSVNDAGDYGSVYVGATTVVGARVNDPAASTTWWIDFSNFFQGVGALGGGNVTLLAGRDIANVDAVIPTNARAPKGKPAAAKLVELGGGDLVVKAGRDISGGVYYVQRGHGSLHAGRDVTTNATRSINLGILQNLTSPARLPENTWMPTTLFLGDATFDVSARGDVLLGPIANPHLLPQGSGNRYWYKTWFSTYGADAAVNASSLVGDITLRNLVTLPDSSSSLPFLIAWLSRQNLLSGTGAAAYYQPWLRLAETSVEPFGTLVTVAAPTLRATAFSGGLDLIGNFNLFPSATGTVEILSAGGISGLGVTGQSTAIVPGQTVLTWQPSRINLSDASPASLPSLLGPLSYYGLLGGSSSVALNNTTQTGFLETLNRAFAETGATNTVLQTKQSLHAAGLLHRDDPLPLYLYALGGDLSGLTLYSAKPAHIFAGRDITDIALYLQNNLPGQLSIVSAGRDIVAYAPNSELRLASRAAGNALNQGLTTLGQQNLAGDIQISGPGSLQVIAGRNLDLGVGPSGSDGTFSGLTSVGNARNPYLPQQGADLFLAAGLDDSALDYAAFAAQFLDPAAGAVAERYLKELAALLPGSPATLADTWAAFQALPEYQQSQYATEIFHLVLRDVGRDYNNPDSPGYRSYTLGYEAIATLFPGDDWTGDISLTARQIKTAAAGNISILAPGGGLAVGLPVSGARADQGILTEAGGDISIFTHGSVDVGTSRIFTLRGGDISIWSSEGDIAAGSAAKTVRSAPPTRVLIDPQSGAVETDLSGLATGGGIGALATVPGLPPSDITLIAPTGTIDAGDAGIRSSGQITTAAAQVLNAANISATGGTSGVPAAAPALNLGSLAAASAAASVAGTGLPQDNIRETNAAGSALEQAPSLISVEVLGFGGSDEEDERNPS